MIICIADVLDDASLKLVRAEIESASFVDGRGTAGWSARLVKTNLQMATGDPAHARIASLVEAALKRNEVFMQAALPLALRPPLISRAEAGMGYGPHVDDALMGAPPLRTDLAYTLFLSAPAEYEGGALVVESPMGAHDFKLAAGSLVLYPATSVHRVETVSAGLRLVAAGWVQSCVRDAARRELLFDLQRARQLVFAQSGKSPAFDLMSKTSGNLLRMWSDV